MKRVYITSIIPEVVFSALAKKGISFDVNEQGKSLTKDDLKRVFSEYDGVVTILSDHVDEEVIASARSLKIIANFAVGFDNIDVMAAKAHGIVVTNTPGVAGEAVAEHTFMLILACCKKLIEVDRFVRSGKYHKWDPLGFLSHQISGKTIGIIGLGSTGIAVSKIAHSGFKMKILYNDIVRSEDFELLSGAKLTPIHELLAKSDFVTLHVPLTSHTHHMIGKKELTSMKDSAYLINMSRGAVVNQEDLIWALSENVIAGAGLDVYEHEPHVPHALSTLGNVVLTPHIGSATYETREATAMAVAENIIAVFEGKTPFGLIKVG